MRCCNDCLTCDIAFNAVMSLSRASTRRSYSRIEGVTTPAEQTEWLSSLLAFCEAEEKDYDAQEQLPERRRVSSALADEAEKEEPGCSSAPALAEKEVECRHAPEKEAECPDHSPEEEAECPYSPEPSSSEA